MSIVWCVRDQLAIVKELLDTASILEERGLHLSEIIILREASERIAKSSLVSIGSLRCTDLRKEIEDVEVFTVRILRKAVRVLAKSIRALDVDQILKKLQLDESARDEIEHIIDVSSSRAKSGVQKALSDIYERLEARFTQVRSSVRAKEPSEALSNEKLLLTYLNSVEEILKKGLLREDEIQTVVNLTLNTILNELNKAAHRISREFNVPIQRVRDAIMNKQSIKERVKREIEKASKLLSTYAVAALIYDLLRYIEVSYLRSNNPNLRVEQLSNSSIIRYLPYLRSIVNSSYRELESTLQLTS